MTSLAPFDSCGRQGWFNFVIAAYKKSLFVISLLDQSTCAQPGRCARKSPRMCRAPFYTILMLTRVCARTSHALHRIDLFGTAITVHTRCVRYLVEIAAIVCVLCVSVSHESAGAVSRTSDMTFAACRP